MSTPQSTTLQPFQLASHVRACAVDGQVILLDLKRGRYLAVGGGHASPLRAAIAGWPSEVTPAQTFGSAAELDALLSPLQQRGLLVPRSGAGPQCMSPPAAVRSLGLHDTGNSLRPGAQDLCRCLQAALRARLGLRWRSLHAIVKAVALRRARHLRSSQDAPSQDLPAAVATFEKLRPLVLTARDQCLLDSLALIHFLAGLGHHPQWALGVRTHPFRAHAWVQWGDTVLNDQHENVQRYQPILVA